MKYERVVADTLKIIDASILEEQYCYRSSYDGFNITKNNLALLRKLRRRIKKSLFNQRGEKNYE